ncbi:conserved hypothetical protein [Lodderomyces elongisporus NRRL YB-4239]|uniref:Serine/threonine-protein kinase MEC1 n=1 Tax=Lodderomyces elongisporus (strain ATCC 11503 / CBS 2605 / JCM 1781 / NBRC 1676 / NRRL YB-4239) TaxID=379508 RepID=A5E2Q8_LODEL|nr:conserved hypothetical protein [Lodderomyces elongisporus NRRL YB-4239]
MTTTQKLSSKELSQFLLDIEKNIDDQETDFKKLILYVFLFTHNKINDFQLLNKPGDAVEMSVKLIDSIELILSKKLYLLNMPLHYNDFKLIHVPQNIMAKGEILFYEWVVSFVLHHISNLHLIHTTSGVTMLNKLKSLFFQVINLVTTRLHSFKFIKSLSTLLMTTLDTGVSRCMEYMQSDIDAGLLHFQSILYTTCHLYLVVNDYDIINKCNMTSQNHQLKLERIGRKLWFILDRASAMVSSSETMQKMAYNLKSLLLLNQADNIILMDLCHWEQVALLLNRISSSILQFFQKRDYLIPRLLQDVGLKNDNKRKPRHYDAFQHTISIVLLKIYKFCATRELVSNFVSSFEVLTQAAFDDDNNSSSNNNNNNNNNNTNNSKEETNTLKDDVNPGIIKITLRIIARRIIELNTEYKDLLGAWLVEDSPTPSFNDAELSQLKFDLEENPRSKEQALYFIIREDLEYHEANDFSDEVNYIEWIKYLKTTIKEYPEEFENELTLYTLMTALSKFPQLCLVNTRDGDINNFNEEENKFVSGPTPVPVPGPVPAPAPAPASAPASAPTSTSTSSHIPSSSCFGTVSKMRPPVKATTESVIFEEIVDQFFLSPNILDRILNEPVLACNFLIMIYNFYAAYIPDFGSCEGKELDEYNAQHDSHDSSDSNDRCNILLNRLLGILATHTNRSTRMLVTRILPLYLIRDADEADLEQIFKFIFQRIALIDFSMSSKRYLAESTIQSLIQLAMVCTGVRLCAVYFKLIDWLGEPNDQHQNYVYCGFLDISRAKNLSTYKLLSPYFPSISDLIIKKPILLDRMLQVLGMSKSYFLSRTRDYTVWKLLEYHKDPTLISQIAEASNWSVEKLLAQNLPKILASYLVRDPTNQRYVVKVLSSVCPHYKQFSTSEIFTHIGDITWNVLLEIQVDHNHAGEVKNLERIIGALEVVATNALISKKQKATNEHQNQNQNQNQERLSKLLIEEQMLLLVQKFSDVTHLLKGAKPYLERIASFQAILYLIRNHADALTSALGQLSTCLQATLEEEDLQILTLTCWHELVIRLPSARLISLIDIVISMIFQRFQTFNSEAQKISIEILKRIYSEIKDKHNRYALYYLSLPFLDYMSDYGFIKEFRNLKSPSRLTIFQEFNRRLSTSNKYVVAQALFDLFNYCEKFQVNCQRDYFKDASLTSTITLLVRTIFDTATQFQSTDPQIASDCAKVLAIIGALDANKFQFKTVQQLIVVQHNFEKSNENAQFLVDLIENYILKLFWASNDPHRQLFSAYAMQNFLTIMNLDENSLERGDSIWNKFGEIAKSTLTPLLNSKYAAQKPKTMNIRIPFLDSSMRYDTWLVGFTSYVLRRGCEAEPNEKLNARQKIFQTCAILINKERDLRLCQHLLKYAVLSHIMTLNTEVVQQIKEEFLYIMQVDLNALSSEERKTQLKLCFQAVFAVFDYLNEWTSSTRHYSNYLVSLDSTTSDLWSDRIEEVSTFLSHFHMDLMAANSVQCDSFERTIMYIEKLYRENHISNTSFIMGNFNAARTLQMMYANLNDYDTLNGILKLFSTNNVKDKLAAFEYSDNSSLAFESFKVSSASTNTATIAGSTGAVGADDQNWRGSSTKLLYALNERGAHDQVLSTLSEKANLNNLRQISSDWSILGLKSAIYAGDIDKLRSWLEVTDTVGIPDDVETSVTYELARSLLFLSNRDSNAVKGSVKSIYNSAGQSLVPSFSSNFSKNVSLMNQLHSTYDLEEVLKSQGSSDIWKIRLTNTDQDYETQMRILSTHIVALQFLGLNEKVSNMLLLESELARENGRFDVSTKAVVRAMALDNPFANVEFAKLLWTQGKQSEAIKSILETLANPPSTDSKLMARVQLQYANWLDESNHVSARQIIEEYKKAFNMDKEYEKSCYDIGKYYSKLMETSLEKSGLYEHLTVRNYLRAVSLSTRYIFEALPKLITVWLDFAKRPKKTKSAEKILLQMVGDVNASLISIPNYIWYTALTQILSRIIHDHEPSFRILATIVTNLIKEFPRHSLWYVLSHVYSTDPKRKQRVETILDVLKRSKRTKDGELIVGAQNLFSKFIEIASKQVAKSPKTKQLSLSRYFGVLDPRQPHTELVIPVQSNLQIRLPQSETTIYTSFPKSASVTFDGFDDVVNIFFSLQMPRQITIRGSDGKPYRLMIKSDDTRKDAKVVEFTTMVNRILQASSEARKRNLSVANYSVIPLSEKIGVIEFVVDVQTMKSIITEERRRRNKVVNERKIFMALELAQKFIKEKRPDENGLKMQALVELFQGILDKNEPLLHHWFVEEFSDPSSWYIARNEFTRSSAVMSIVGYLIGLGDRHCENILLFKKSGAVLHIDFDCLFEKGKSLPTPEVVPFRLTQNMVDAMGICGVDGGFRVSCEVVGKLLRSNEQSLMNILENLLYDPLLDWKINQNPQHDLSKVRKKIRGLINEDEGLAMNVHGQVDVLIQEATSIERLARMYGGWSAYV